MPGSLPLFTKIVLFPLQPAHSQEARAGVSDSKTDSHSNWYCPDHALVSKKKRIQTDAEDLVYLSKPKSPKHLTFGYLC